MPAYTVVLLHSGTSAPLRHVQVEAKSIATGKSLSVKATNDQGVAVFALAEEARFEALMSGEPPKMQVTVPTAAGGVFHMDYAVDAAYTGTEGASVVLATGNSVRIFSTIQGAITAADLEDGDISIFIAEGDYNETVVIPTTWTSGHDLFILGEATDKVLWGPKTPGTGHALEIIASGQSSRFWFKNITFQGGTAVADRSVKLTPPNANMEAHFEDCIFEQEMGGDYLGATFRDCDFKKGFHASISPNIVGPDEIDFIGCTFQGTNNWARTMGGMRFTNCRWPGLGDVIVNTSQLFNCHFVNCRLGQPGAGGKLFFHKNGGNIRNVTFTGCEFAPPGANATVWLQSLGSPSVIRFTGCHFERVAANTTPFLRSDDVSSEVTVIGCFLEEGDTVIPITGIFRNSVFGPNQPPNFLLQLDAGSSNNLYIGTGTPTGIPPTTVIETFTEADHLALGDASPHHPQLVQGTGIQIVGNIINHEDDSPLDLHDIYQLRSEANPAGGYGNDMSREWVLLVHAGLDVFVASET